MRSIIRIITTIPYKLATWGLRGAFDWLLRQGSNRRKRRFFKANARRHSRTRPLPGITIVGAFSSSGSLSKVLRDFAHSLKDVGIPFQALDIGNNRVPPVETADILTLSSEFNIRRFTHSVELIASDIPNGIVPCRSRLVFWEYDEGIAGAYPCLKECADPIIAMSDFNLEYFRREFGEGRKIVKVKYPLRMDVSGVASKDECCRKFGLGVGKFIVFYNFSFGSGFHRKNCAGVIKAFSRAFAGNQNARLLMKTSGKANFPQYESEFYKIAEEEGIGDQLVVFDSSMSQREIYELTNCCDVYLSLHRSEGFGLGIAEAMCLSKAVVVTAYGAPVEFCNSENSILVPYTMTAIRKEEKTVNPIYRLASNCAEPNIDEAAKALAQLGEDTSLRERLGAKARSFVETSFSNECFRESVVKFLSNGD